MWLQLGIAVAVLVWLVTPKAKTAPPAAPFEIPTGGLLNTGGDAPGTITFHEGAGIWDTPAVGQSTSKPPEECDYACQGFIL